MDHLFQTLLFSPSKGENNGDTLARTIPRPSRYAQLRPRESLRVDADGGEQKRKDGKKERKVDKNLNSDDVQHAGGNEDDNIEVYRLNDVGGLELVPHEDYDVVYLGEKDDSENNDQQLPEDGADGESMEIDTEDTQPDEQPTLYIVHKDPPTSMQHIPSHQDDTSSTSDSTTSESPTQSFYNTHNPRNDKITAESSMAQTLTRVLVQRTAGFNSIRRNFGLDEEEREERLKKSKEKKKKASAAAAGGAPSASAAAAGSKDKKEAQVVKTDDLTAEEDEDEEKDVGHCKGHKLLSTILSSTHNITDGDDPQTLMKLTKMRIWQENHISPDMQGINLENWEDGIDWEGGVSSDEEEGEAANKGSSNVPYNPETADCTPDFRPAEPEGGYPKRLKRTSPYVEDPIQILYEPRNPRLDALDLCETVDWEGACSDSDEDYEPPNVPLILQSSMAGKSIASLLAPLPSSRPLPFEAHPSYQQRYDRELSSEITSTADLAQSNIPGANEALERYKEMRQKKREQMAKDKQSRVTEVMSSLSLTGTGRRITSSLMGPGGAERTGRPNRHAMGSSSAHDAEYVEQLEFVYSHNIVKPELSMSEYRQFHRPRLPCAVVTPSCPWQFQTRVVAKNKKDSRGVTTAADGSTMIGSYHSMMSAGSKAQTKIRNEADLTPALGDLVIMEYSEERPPLFMTKGMTCRIVNYYRGDRARCPISAGGGDRPQRQRHGDKAALSKGPMPAGPSGRIERPPRLIGPNQYNLKSAADLIGINLSKSKKSKEAVALEAKKAKEMAVDVLPEGVTEILHPKVHGPFIGEVEEGKTQTGLISNLFAASMFMHKSEPTDFLMILGKKQSSTTLGSANNELGVVLRPFPRNIFCVGQTEPRVKVFAPSTNEEKKFVNAFIGYQCAKHIERAEHHDGMGLTFEFIKDRLFKHSKIPATQLRIRLKQVANFDRTNEGIWKLKPIGQDDFPGVEGLGRKVSPEGIAAYESQLAAAQRLKDLGVKDLHTGANNIVNVASVMIFLNGAVQAAMERKMKMKKVLDIKKRQKSPQLPYFEKAYAKLDQQHKEVKKRQEIAKFIYQELQLAPWTISGEFIDVHKRAQGSAMMKLTGIGDPSGVGEAFNYLREDERKPNKALLSNNNDGALNAQIKKITGTENDLRKLTMKQMASLLRSYGMKDKQIAVLKRWDRVHVIRDLSTKAASDGMGDDMERFARGEKLRLSDQRDNYKKRVQEIWRRQVAALTSDAAVNDVSARSDLALGPGKEGSEVDTESDAGKAKVESDDSDDDDDEFAAMMEMEMTNTGEANRLVAMQLGESSMRGGSLDTQELSKEARELAALQRQREEERAMQDGLEQKVRGDRSNKPKKYHKVIRRKIIKTHLDGRQEVNFEFIVQKDKVEEIIAKIRSDPEGKKKKKHGDEDTGGDAIDGDGTCVGHAFFEDDDNLKRSTKLGIKLKREAVKASKAKGPHAKKAAHSKLTSLAKHSHVEKQEQRKKKRLKLQEESELYKVNHRSKGTSNRKERGAARDRMPHVILSDRFESVRSAVESRPTAGAFHKPVSREMYPQYYEKIHEPIDLQTIREKNRKYDYKTASSFLRDFDLMRRNAINFNGKESPLAKEATEIYEFVKSTIEQNKEEFDQMEEAVQDQINNGRRKKKMKVTKTKSKACESSSSKSAPMNTASVVLDGVATQVNLGTNLSFGFGGDSDSDDS